MTLTDWAIQDAGHAAAASNAKQAQDVVEDCSRKMLAHCSSLPGWHQVHPSNLSLLQYVLPMAPTGSPQKECHALSKDHGMCRLMLGISPVSCWHGVHAQDLLLGIWTPSVLAINCHCCKQWGQRFVRCLCDISANCNNHSCKCLHGESIKDRTAFFGLQHLFMQLGTSSNVYMLRER